MAGVPPALGKDFVSRHISSYTDGVPQSWGLDPGGFYYSLDLKMMNLPGLVFGFKWNDGARRPTDENQKLPLRDSEKSTSLPAVEKPWRIVAMNLSMNELCRLHHEGFQPFSQLRLLDASLNKIDFLVGLEMCRELRHLALSHNNIGNLEGLHGCPHLLYLDLSVNLLHEVSRMPNLPALTKLNISNNKIKSLSGMQALPRLAELHADKNYITDVIPLAGSFNLKLLNLGGNEISSLRITIETLTSLTRLEALILKDNPIATERSYKGTFTEALPGLISLDHDLVRIGSKSQMPMVSGGPLEPGSLGRQVALKAAARRVFLDQLADRKRLLGNNISYFNKKIRDLQSEYEDYERNMQKELDACMRYIDNLSLDDLNRREKTEPYREWPWLNSRDHLQQSWNSLGEDGSLFPLVKQRSPQLQHTGVKDTDEVLRLASNQLAHIKRQ